MGGTITPLTSEESKVLVEAIKEKDQSNDKLTTKQLFLATPIGRSITAGRALFDSLVDTDNFGTDEPKEFLDAFKEAVADDVLITDATLSQEELEKCLSGERLKDRALLLEHIGFLASEHARVSAYNRIHLLEAEAYSPINKLFLKPAAKEFFEISPDQLSELTPNIKLFKVKYADVTAEPTDIEMSFDDHTQVDVDEVLSSNFSRGSGVGLKSFDWEFVGTNPISAPNDIRGKLVLKFQDMKDLFAERIDGKGQVYHYSDLVLNPQVFDTDVENAPDRLIFDDQHFKIKAILGWSFLQTDQSQITDPNLIKAIQESSIVLYLTCISTEFKFAQNGTFTLTVKFIGALNADLVNPTADILFDRSLRERRAEREAKLKALDGSELDKIQAAYESEAQRELTLAYESIMKEMVEKDLVYHFDVTADQLETYAADGRLGLTKPIITELNNKNEQKSPDAKRIHYFFFGDLINLVYERLYIDEINSTRLKRARLILGTIEYLERGLGGSPGSIKRINVADIPITVDGFNVFFANTVVQQKKTEYSLLIFLKDTTKNLIVDALGEDTFGNFALQYGDIKTFNLTLPAPSGVDPLDAWKTAHPLPNGRVDITKVSSGEPIASAINYQDIKDCFHYIVLYVADKAPSDKLEGNYDDDFKNGIYHLHFGTNRGLVKNISFKKTETPGLSEARFTATTSNPFQRLSAVYDVEIEMAGNTYFYPGSRTFVNPIGLGPSIGSPLDKSSFAFIMGLGGYHLVTNVSCFIQGGKFVANITARWQSSGAKDEALNTVTQPINKTSESQTSDANDLLNATVGSNIDKAGGITF